MNDEQIPVGSKWRSGDGDVVTVLAVADGLVRYGDDAYTTLSRDFLCYFKRIEEPKPALESEIPVGSRWRGISGEVAEVIRFDTFDRVWLRYEGDDKEWWDTREPFLRVFTRIKDQPPAPALKPGDVVKDPALLKPGMRVRVGRGEIVWTLTARRNQGWECYCELWPVALIVAEDFESGKVTYLGGPDEAEATHNKPSVGKYPAWKLEIASGSSSEPKPSDPWEEHLRQERKIAEKMRSKNAVQFIRNLREQQAARQFTGTWSPSVSGLGGMVGGIHRRR